jgi:hypothetical protein
VTQSEKGQDSLTWISDIMEQDCLPCIEQDCLPCLEQLEQQDPNVVFNSFGVDVINCILRHINLYISYLTKCDNKDCGCSISNHIYHNTTFFTLRLVSRKWDRAAKMCIPQWAAFLEQNGPKHISTNSQHRDDRWINKNSCKFNAMTGKCTIAAHYPYNQLKANYAKDDAFGFYRETMKIMGKKHHKSRISKQKKLTKQVEQDKKRLQLWKQDIEYSELRLKQLETDSEMFDEHYQPFLKRVKTTATKTATKTAKTATKTAKTAKTPSTTTKV